MLMKNHLPRPLPTPPGLSAPGFGLNPPAKRSPRPPAPRPLPLPKPCWALAMGLILSPPPWPPQSTHPPGTDLLPKTFSPHEWMKSQSVKIRRAGLFTHRTQWARFDHPSDTFSSWPCHVAWPAAAWPSCGPPPPASIWAAWCWPNGSPADWPSCPFGYRS